MNVLLCMILLATSHEDAFNKIIMLRNNVNLIEAERIGYAVSVAAKETGLDNNLIVAIIRYESYFNKRAKGQHGERGLMQILPSWLKNELCTDINLWDPQQNVLCGSRILKYYIEMFGDTYLGIAAYNTGERTVRRGGKTFRSHYANNVLKYATFLDTIDNIVEDIRALEKNDSNSGDSAKTMSHCFQKRQFDRPRNCGCF